MAALREMGRVCRPGGIVAARDSDYAAIAWFPADPELDRWLELYEAVARRNGGEPDAGRRLLAWAHEAGFDGRDAVGERPGATRRPRTAPGGAASGRIA